LVQILDCNEIGSVGKIIKNKINMSEIAFFFLIRTFTMPKLPPNKRPQF
jgi:hypothetical protein